MTRPGVGEVHAADIDWGGDGHSLLVADERAPEGALYELLEDARLPAIDEVLLERCARRLRHREGVLHWLDHERGIAVDTASSFQLGLTLDTRRDFGVGGHEARLVVPIYDERGKCMNASLYSRRAQPKLLRLVGRLTRLFPQRAFVERLGQPLVAAEGELDAMLAWQHGARTITSGGALTLAPWRRNIRRFRGERVWVAFDRDAAGGRGAEKLSELLMPIAAQVRIVTIPIARPGADLSDWILSMGEGGGPRAA